MEWQLRDYRIAEGHLDDFVQAWTSGVLPLRRAAGFHVQAWIVPAESRFIWILGFPGPSSFESADAAYYASPARGAIAPDPAQWIAEQHVRMLEPIAAGNERPGTLRA